MGNTFVKVQPIDDFVLDEGMQFDNALIKKKEEIKQKIINIFDDVFNTEHFDSFMATFNGLASKKIETDNADNLIYALGYYKKDIMEYLRIKSKYNVTYGYEINKTDNKHIYIIVTPYYS